MRPKPLVFLIRRIVLLLVLALCTAAQANPLKTGEACKLAINKKYEVVIAESMSDGEVNYREVEGLRFGMQNGGQVFFQYNEGSLWMLEEIPFKGFQGKIVRLSSDDVAVERSEVFMRNEGVQTLLCLLVPFSGPGSSGSHQAYAALVAVSFERGKEIALVGQIIRRW